MIDAGDILVSVAGGAVAILVSIAIFEVRDLRREVRSMLGRLGSLDSRVAVVETQIEERTSNGSGSGLHALPRGGT